MVMHLWVGLVLWGLTKMTARRLSKMGLPCKAKAAQYMRNGPSIHAFCKRVGRPRVPRKGSAPCVVLGCAATTAGCCARRCIHPAARAVGGSGHGRHQHGWVGSVAWLCVSGPVAHLNLWHAFIQTLPLLPDVLG
jgi:hypothetical protein